MLKNKQCILQKLIECGWVAIEQIWACEMMVTSVCSVPADEECAAAAWAAEVQKCACQACDEKWQQMADKEQLYCSWTVKLVNLLVASFNESLEQERAMNQQFTVFLTQCMCLFERMNHDEAASHL